MNSSTCPHATYGSRGAYMYLHYKLLKHSLKQTLAMIVFRAWYCSKPTISEVMSFWPLRWWLLRILPNIRAVLKVFNYEVRGQNVNVEEMMIISNQTSLVFSHCMYKGT